ncbi:hypothetical protein EIN_488770 [Entamoeba invadens IP1]|uniref:Glucosamine 6-phosphate N-acetyltransferase n=1 Tax=Entamoeba invadens IP1 TaxID=370355 RepID=L7FNJ6_ENTIV|nr:hypothetical protein EIN_488770 [Entamoeba invadens IP1]ELP94562.1 hypothetical protein EIN_488770 [Entamoeba invadens IP1]|eukprot:XP_004261333.1 hypothetical protein EIN_488770 [Entamoeba invadens IP1]
MRFKKCGKYIGHIEDVVVSSTCRGNGLGKFLIETLIKLGRNNNCHKIILDCKDRVKPFYEKCGITYKDNCMAICL